MPKYLRDGLKGLAFLGLVAGIIAAAVYVTLQ